MKPWSRAILAAIERKGLPERQVSLAAVGHESAIRSLKRGMDARGATLAALAAELDLEFYVGPPRAQPPARLSAEESGIHVTHLSACLGAVGVRFSAEGCAWFGEGVLAGLDTDPAFCRAVEVLDGSMAPALPPASVVMVDLQRTVPCEGGIFLVGRAQAPALRRLVRNGEDWILKPDNPDWPDQPLDDADELIGKALWRSFMLPPQPPGRRDAPVVKVTKTVAGELRPWPVPYRGRLSSAARDADGDMAAWFEMDFLRALDIDPLQAEVVTVSDGSMMPMLPASAAVLIDRRRTTRRHGDICALWTGVELVLRRLVRDGQRWEIATEDELTRPLRPSDEILGTAVWTGAFLPQNGPY